MHPAVRHALLAPLVAALALAVHAEDWPRFRGPTGQGISSERGLPVKFEKDRDIKCQASMAASDGALFVRSEKRLFCIRKGS